LADNSTKSRFKTLPAEPAKIKDFFNRVGPRFYSCFFGLVGYRSSLRYFVRANHQRFGLREGMRVLDAGIGTGFLTIGLLREAPVPLTITGLDFSAGMLAGLGRRLERLGLDDRVRLHLGDMRRMPLRDGCFDLVVSSAAMEYLPEVWDGIAECARVLRPGGRLLIIATRDSFMGKLVAATWRNKTLETTYVKQCMERAGLGSVESLRFPAQFAYVNWWGMALLGEKAG